MMNEKGKVVGATAALSIFFFILNTVLWLYVFPGIFNLESIIIFSTVLAVIVALALSITAWYLNKLAQKKKMLKNKNSK